MTLRTFFIITAVVSFVFGLGFLLSPKMMAELYGVPFSQSVAMMDRYFGTALLGLGLFAWALKDMTDPVLIPRVLVAHGVHDAIGCVVSIHAVTTNAINALGWGSVVLYAALAAGCVALYRSAPTATLRPV